MKAVKILITEMGSVKNKGNMAILKGTLTALAQYVPEAEFTVLSHGPRDELNTLNIRALPSITEVPHSDLSSLTKTLETVLNMLKLSIALLLGSLWAGRNSFFKNDLTFLTRYSRLKEYAASDIIVIRGTDTITDEYGQFKLDSLFMRCSGILLGVVMKKPTVLCGHSIGPFTTRIGRLMARFVLNKVSLITVREEISQKTLSEINVKNPNIFQTADLAFLMQPVSPEKAMEILHSEGISLKRPTIGISASRLISTYIPSVSKGEAYKKYVDFMTNITDYVIENFHVDVVLVPHVTGPGKDYDDRLVSEDIERLVQNKQNVKSIRGDYSPEALRGVIGLFDMFIGSRMHAVISAVSMKVPSLMLAYLSKSQGIMQTLGQDKWICNIQELNYNDAVAKIVSLWDSRKELREELEERMPIVRDKAFLNAKLIQTLLKTQNPSK